MSKHWQRESLAKINKLPFEAKINGNQWKPKKGKGLRCLFLECKQEVLAFGRFNVDFKVQEYARPKPEPNIIWIEQPCLVFNNLLIFYI